MDTLALKYVDKLWPGAALVAKLGSLGRFQRRDPRPLILRPGGMGDLILLCVAAEQLGVNPRAFFWMIERRSKIWAKHLGLDYICYDEGFLAQHWRIAGRFSRVVNSEQLFGLSQATALLARARGGILTCFETNRAASWADRRVAYDADRTHEAVAFQDLLAAGLDIPHKRATAPPRRVRKHAPSEKPIVGIGGLQSHTRAFSEEQWSDAIRSWIGGRAFWIASSETDRMFAQRLQMRFTGQAQVFSGSFDQLCNLIRRSVEVFTVDGGFLHIASYYGVPSVSIFTSGRDRKWSPLAPGSCVIRRSDLACQPCTWFGQAPSCPNGLACKELNYEEHLGAAS
jgi:hypothetical protein